MGIFSRLFLQISANNPSHPIKTNESFNQDHYNCNNQRCIDNFEKSFNLESIDGIRAITVAATRKWAQNAADVPSLPEQILFKKATEHKKNRRMDLAVACLEKANELLPYSSCRYLRSDYERLVNYLVEACRFDEARIIHAKLDQKFGSNIMHLESLNQKLNDTEEQRIEYQSKVIEPRKREERDREEYYWLLAHMNKEAPKSFASYRRMKSQKTENYRNLLNKVKELGFNLEQITFWEQSV